MKFNSKFLSLHWVACVKLAFNVIIEMDTETPTLIKLTHDFPCYSKENKLLVKKKKKNNV